MEVGEIGHIDLADLVAVERIKTTGSLEASIEALQEKVVDRESGR